MGQSEQVRADCPLPQLIEGGWQVSVVGSQEQVHGPGAKQPRLRVVFGGDQTKRRPPSPHLLFHHKERYAVNGLMAAATGASPRCLPLPFIFLSLSLLLHISYTHTIPATRRSPDTVCRLWGHSKCARGVSFPPCFLLHKTILLPVV